MDTISQIIAPVEYQRIPLVYRKSHYIIKRMLWEIQQE